MNRYARLQLQSFPNAPIIVALTVGATWTFHSQELPAKQTSSSIQVASSNYFIIGTSCPGCGLVKLDYAAGTKIENFGGSSLTYTTRSVVRLDDTYFICGTQAGEIRSTTTGAIVSLFATQAESDIIAEANS